MFSRRLCAFFAAVALCVAAAVPATASAQDPILFVHGWSESASLWNTMIGRFEKDGYAKSSLSAYSYNTSQSNKVDAEKEVKSHVESLLKTTGASKVDIIAHSMGSLNTRWYIKFLGGESKVDDWVSLGGPNHGTETANACSFQVSCQEMQVGSKFLSELNAGDETPGTVNYGTWWSPCDEIINPDSSVALSGATNTKTACLSHTALTTDETVYTQVREFVK
ncbi:MAG TPA: lipase [Solirubrobacterales bacterium]|jgi:triacylglycerol esterase/lipase EstA (alpha/beta hydrolase family)|nr:lipase [Solirubrobacterales bacterium]